MSKPDTTQKSYMALGPLSSLAGIFINPLASTATPLLLYFLFRIKRPQVAEVALQTADLAFSIQLWIVLISLANMLGISLDMVTVAEAKEISKISTAIILAIFVVSLVVALYHALMGKGCKHLFSFRIAERVFKLIEKRNAI